MLEVLRLFRPEADNPPAGIADRPHHSAWKPRVGQEIRGPDFVGREPVAEQSVPDRLGQGKVAQGKLFQFPQVEPPLVQASTGRPPGVVAPAFCLRQVGAGRQLGLSLAEIRLPQPVGRMLGMDRLRIHRKSGPGKFGHGKRAGIDHASRAIEDDCSGFAGDVKSGGSREESKSLLPGGNIVPSFSGELRACRQLRSTLVPLGKRDPRRALAASPPDAL